MEVRYENNVWISLEDFAQVVAVKHKRDERD
jgi:hypothetical protein